jgi:SAM-dependent methyltransferase
MPGPRLGPLLGTTIGTMNQPDDRRSLPPTEAQRAATLARFEEHRRAWLENAALRELYRGWYLRVAHALASAPAGPRVELGSGPGFAREFIADLELTDLVAAPWLDRQASADALPYADRSVAALVLFDVLHHLASPHAFFQEAERVLVDGGVIVLCEPLISLLSYPVWKLLHDEPLRLWVDPLHPALDPGKGTGQDLGQDAGKDPFDANQAIPTLLFCWRRRRFQAAFPSLRILTVEKLAGPSYPASGGFSHRPLLPMWIWRGLLAFEQRLPKLAFSFAGFRLLVVLRRQTRA